MSTNKRRRGKERNGGKEGKRRETKEKEGKRTSQRLIPLLNLLHRIVINTPRPLPSHLPPSFPPAFPRSRSPSALLSTNSPLLIQLSLRRNHPRMSQQLLRPNPQIRVLLKTLQQKIPHDGARSFGERRTIIINDPKQRRHRVKKVVGRFGGEKFDDERSEGPDVGGSGGAGLVYYFGGHPVG